MHTAFTSCGTGIFTSSDPCNLDNAPINRISVTHEAVRCINYERSAQSTIVLNQRAPGIWSLSASNGLALTQDSDDLRIVFGVAQSVIALSLNQVTVAGGQNAIGSGPHVNVINPLDVVYISGDDTTDGSIRLRLDSGDGLTHVEERTLGVWNPASLELSGGSLHLGQGLLVSAGGDHLQIENTDNENRRLLPEIPFDDTGNIGPTAPLPGALVERFIFQSDLSDIITSTVHTVSGTSGLDTTVSAYYFQVGPVPPVEPVLLQVKVDGVLFLEKSFPASQFLANTEVRLDISPGFGFRPNKFIEAQLTSPVAFDLLGNVPAPLFAGPAPPFAGPFLVGQGEVWVAVDIQLITHEPIFSFPTGFDRLLFDVSSSMIIDNSGTPIASGDARVP